MITASTNKMIRQIQMCLTDTPVERAWLFGSYSRGEERSDSDVDILVKYSKDAVVSLFTISRIMLQLSRALGRRVDLIEEDAVLPFASESANSDKILIYERGN